MKVQSRQLSNYTQPKVSKNNQQNPSQNGKAPSFGLNLSKVGGMLGASLIGFATFIENNGFMGEFLTIDTFGMMGPRVIQGYGRNREELGHLNYKAGREEAVRELLSGPAYFFVPLIVMSAVALLRGGAAKVGAATLDAFKPVIQKVGADFKNPNAVKQGFVKELVSEAFTGFNKKTHLKDEIGELLIEKVTRKFDWKNPIASWKRSSEVNKQLAEKLSLFNKANGQFLDSTRTINVSGKKLSISTLIKESSDYLNDFTNKARKTSHSNADFIEKFHAGAQKLRLITNVLALSALSAFLVIIPKIYKTGDSFPGEDGLKKQGQPAQPAANASTADVAKKEAV